MSDVIEENFKSKVKSVYQTYQNVFDFIGYATAGSAIAIAVASSFGLPIIAGVATNLIGTSVSFAVSEMRKKEDRFDEFYKKFQNSLKLREILLAPLNTEKGQVKKKYQQIVKKYIMDVDSDINTFGKALIKIIQKERKEDEFGEISDALDTLEERITDAMLQKVTEEYKEPNDVINESPLAVKASVALTRGVVHLVKNINSSRIRERVKLLRDTTESDLLKQLDELQRITAIELVDGRITGEEYLQMTRFILLSMKRKKIDKRLLQQL